MAGTDWVQLQRESWPRTPRTVVVVVAILVAALSSGLYARVANATPTTYHYHGLRFGYNDTRGTQSEYFFAYASYATLDELTGTAAAKAACGEVFHSAFFVGACAKVVNEVIARAVGTPRYLYRGAWVEFYRYTSPHLPYGTYSQSPSTEAYVFTYDGYQYNGLPWL